MSMLAREEQAKYERIWGVPLYARNSPGERLAPAFVDMTHPHADATILDAGCGSGKGAIALRALGYHVTMCDITDSGIVDEAKGIPFFPAILWEDQRAKPRRWMSNRWTGSQMFDHVYCCDVLEHIPPTFTMLVVARLLEVARKGVFLSIALQMDDFGAWAGEALHQTIQPYVVWREQLSALAHVTESRDLLNNGLFYLEHRRG
jgi:2-polyprenyl-3-methyl-5-hydroxy-6-metoxy-1,4-benzoquinol methylase